MFRQLFFLHRTGRARRACTRTHLPGRCRNTEHEVRSVRGAKIEQGDSACSIAAFLIVSHFLYEPVHKTVTVCRHAFPYYDAAK